MGGANTTAVAEIVAVELVPIFGATIAPVGILGAVGFDFWGAARRTGAKASEADHPLENRIEERI